MGLVHRTWCKDLESNGVLMFGLSSLGESFFFFQASSHKVIFVLVFFFFSIVTSSVYHDGRTTGWCHVIYLPFSAAV